MSRLLLALLLCLWATPVAAQRTFDGVDDRINLGSDANLDNFTTRSFCAWVNRQGDNANMLIAQKGAASGANNILADGGANDRVRVQADSATDGLWSSPASSLAQNAWAHVCVTYDNTSTANAPVIWINGVSQTVTTTTSPVDPVDLDAAFDFLLGETNAGTLDYTGDLVFPTYHNTIFDAAVVNRHKWWGMAPGGPSTMRAWLPLWTDSLVNQGTVSVTATATGTTVTTTRIPKVLRPGGGGVW